MDGVIHGNWRKTEGSQRSERPFARSAAGNDKNTKRYLEAIERGNFDILPGKFYARAFIKEYAAAVGLDAKELLEEHKEEIPQTEEDNSSQYTYIHRSRKDNNPAKRASVFH